MSISHLVILGLIILVAVPPEKLPDIMRNIGRFINDLKRQTNGIFSEMNSEFNNIKKDMTPDIRLTPDDMLKKLQDQNNKIDPATVAASEDSIKKDAINKPDQTS